MTRPTDPTVDLRQIRSALGANRRWIAAGALLGLVAALLVIWLVRPQYESTTTVLVREFSSPTGGALAGGGGSGRGTQGGNGGGVVLGGLRSLLSLDAGIETELEVLASRSVIGAVVDSLGLQAEVRSPRATPLSALVSGHRFDPESARTTYDFERQGDRFRVRGGGLRETVGPGGSIRLGSSAVTLQPSGLPDRFVLRLRDRQDAIDDVERRVRADQAAGEVAEVRYRHRDPVTAAAVANGLVDQYLARRRTTDRGVNQRLYEFLSAHTDSIALGLRDAEGMLRSYQEDSGVLDPEIQGQAEVERAIALRAELEGVEVEARAIEEVIRQGQAGGLSARELAGYPTLMQNPAINTLLARLYELDSQRAALLERRTAQDPDVLLVGQHIEDTERQIVSLATSYRAGLRSKERELRNELARYQSTLARLPAFAEETFRRQRDVERLSQTLMALETQLVQARLAAITEGGDVRRVDAAEVAKRPTFPNRPLTLALGLFGGLFFGTVGAIGQAFVGRRIRYPWEAEMAVGVPTVGYVEGVPLLVRGFVEDRPVMVVSIDGQEALPVAEGICRTAATRHERVLLADLTSTEETPPRDDRETRDNLPMPVVEEGGHRLVRIGSGRTRPTRLHRMLEELESGYSAVVVALPPLDHPATLGVLGPEASVFVAGRAGRLIRTRLQDVVAGLQTAGIEIEGIVLVDDSNGRGGR